MIKHFEHRKNVFIIRESNIKGSSVSCTKCKRMSTVCCHINLKLFSKKKGVTNRPKPSPLTFFIFLFILRGNHYLEISIYHSHLYFCIFTT